MYNLNKNDMCNAAFVLYLQNMVCMVRLRQRKCQRRYHQPPLILSPCTITRQNKVEHSASEQYFHFCSKRLQIKLMRAPSFPFYQPPPPPPTCAAVTPPSRPVPVPNGTTGICSVLHSLATLLTWSTLVGNTTASGGRPVW